MEKIKGLFKRKKTEITNEHIRLNIKGQQIKSTSQDTFNQNTFNESLKNAKTIQPSMFNLKTRTKIWGNLGLFSVYLFILYKLMLYRLKADDLDLMEREVKEEFEIKRKIKEMNK